MTLRLMGLGLVLAAVTTTAAARAIPVCRPGTHVVFGDNTKPGGSCAPDDAPNAAAAPTPAPAAPSAPPLERSAPKNRGCACDAGASDDSGLAGLALLVLMVAVARRTRGRAGLALSAAGLAIVVLAVSCKKQSDGEPKASSCKSDDECTFSCEAKGDCCHNPYCETPALKSVAHEAQSYNRTHCKQEDYARCPAVGSRGKLDYALELHCRNGACVADKHPVYDTSCATKADCRVVKSPPCSKCACASTPIAASEVPRFQAANDCTKAPADPRACGECRGSVPDCVGGHCVAVPEP